MAADGSEAAYCKSCHCYILPRISNLSDREKIGETQAENSHYKARRELTL
jgi:ferredoxin